MKWKPDFKNKLTNPWWKNTASSVVGTVLGIALTFGTSNWVENSKKQEVQRQTAMMVIHDIDEIADALLKKHEDEGRLYKVVIYATYDLDELDSIPEDSLRMVLDFISSREGENDEWTDNAKEQMFMTNMEVYKNLNSTQFTDNVRECYSIRRKLQSLYESNSLNYQKPISQEEMKQLLLGADANEISLFDRKLKRKGLIQLLKQKFKERQVQLFISAYGKRDSELCDGIKKLRELNDKNKFLMNITDEDMEEFVNKTEHLTQSVTDNKLVGTWQWVNHTWVLRKDKTFLLHLDVSISNKYATTIVDKDGAIQMKLAYVHSKSDVNIKGKWNLRGDSLAFEISKDSVEVGEFKIDYQKLPRRFLKEKKDEIENDLKEINELHLPEMKSELHQRLKIPNRVALDITGNILFMTDEEGESMRLVRQKESKKE